MASNPMMPYDVSTDTSAASKSLSENTYGPIADQYAQKYGVPTQVMRDVIDKVSGWDPNYSGAHGRGIANQDTTFADDVGKSMDLAAAYLADQYTKYGNWDMAKSTYPGYGGGEMGGVGDNPVDNNGDPVDNSWGGKITAYLKSAGYTILIVAVGLVLILGSTWVLINSTAKK